MLRKYLPVCIGIVLLGMSVTVEARTNINLDIGISSPPPSAPPNVAMSPPVGFDTCYIVPGGWAGHVWVPQHQECSYPGPTAALWVSGYWGCVSFGPGGHCGHWRWYGNRWVRGSQARYHTHHYDRGYHHRYY